MKKVAKLAICMVVIVLSISACRNHSKNEIRVPIGGLLINRTFHGVPYRITDSTITTPGKQLGTIDGGTEKVFLVPGISPDQSIAILSNNQYFIMNIDTK